MEGKIQRFGGGKGKAISRASERTFLKRRIFGKVNRNT